MAENRNQVSNGADRQSAPPSRGNRGSFVDSGRALQGDVQQLASHVQETTNELQTLITDQVRQRPYAVLATAAGIGYLLGGGLSSRLTLMAFGVATRFAMAMAAREMGAWATEGFSGGGQGQGSQAQTRH